MRLRHRVKPSNMDSSNVRGTLQINIHKESSSLEKVNSDQHEIDLKVNSVWLSTEKDDINVSLLENSIQLNAELKKKCTVNDKVNAKGLILWPESQPSALTIQKGHQKRPVISYVQITYQMKTLNRKLSHHHFHLIFCSVLLRAMINIHSKKNRQQ